MNENQLRQLVEMVRCGDQKAFNDLYNATKNSVYFICVGMLKNEEDAKDIMQETYFTAYNYLYQLNDGGKFLPWINQIAANKCKRVLNQKKPDYNNYDDMGDDCMEDNENFLPEEYVLSAEKRKIVVQVMRKVLSDIQYETVLLYYFSGMTIEEIAKLMECPEGTVKYRLSVSRAKIRDGVLAYEKKTGDKLYTLTLPFLTYLMYSEAQELFVPDVFNDVVSSIYAAAAQNTTQAVNSTQAATQIAANVATDVSANTAGKVGLGIMKKKLIIAIASIAVVGAGVVALVIGLGNKDKNDNDDETTADNGVTTEAFLTDEDDTEEATEAPTSDFSGDWEAEEEHGYSPFWIKYANLASYGTMDIDSISLAGGMYNPSSTVTDILSKGWKVYNLYTATGSPVSTFNSYDELINYTGEIAKGSNMIEPGVGGYTYASIRITAYENEDGTGHGVDLTIYNMTDSEVTLMQCIENNSYEMNGYMFDYLMLSEYKDKGTFRDWMSEVMPTFGTPDYACCLLNMNMNTDREGADETFEETIEYGGGSLVYNFYYYRDGYVFCIECSEQNYLGRYEGYATVKKWSQDVFDKYIKTDYEFEAEYNMEIK